MDKYTSISLGDHFEEFVKNKIQSGGYKNASEVIIAGLRLLEEEEQKFDDLKTAIQEGIDSPIIESFNPEEHLRKMKLERSSIT